MSQIIPLHDRITTKVAWVIKTYPFRLHRFIRRSVWMHQECGTTAALRNISTYDSIDVDLLCFTLCRRPAFRWNRSTGIDVRSEMTFSIRWAVGNFAFLARNEWKWITTEPIYESCKSLEFISIRNQRNIASHWLSRIQLLLNRVNRLNTVSQ